MPQMLQNGTDGAGVNDGGNEFESSSAAGADAEIHLKNTLQEFAPTQDSAFWARLNLFACFVDFRRQGYGRGDHPRTQAAMGGKDAMKPDEVGTRRRNKRHQFLNELPACEFDRLRTVVRAVNWRA